MWTTAGVDIPRTQPGAGASDVPRQGPREPGGRKILVLEIPDVAHRRVDVAQVECAWRYAHPLGDRMAGRDHDVVAGEVEALDRPGEDRQEPAVAPLGVRQPLQERGVDRVGFDRRRARPAPPHQRVDRGRGEEPRDALEHVLAAPIARDPVVNQGDAPPGRGRAHAGFGASQCLRLGCGGGAHFRAAGADRRRASRTWRSSAESAAPSSSSGRLSSVRRSASRRR